jgi:hypothetical protein
VAQRDKGDSIARYPKPNDSALGRGKRLAGGSGGVMAWGEEEGGGCVVGDGDGDGGPRPAQSIAPGQLHVKVVRAQITGPLGEARLSYANVGVHNRQPWQDIQGTCSPCSSAERARRSGERKVGVTSGKGDRGSRMVC